jgi:hypothetical protein
VSQKPTLVPSISEHNVNNRALNEQLLPPKPNVRVFRIQPHPGRSIEDWLKNCRLNKVCKTFNTGNMDEHLGTDIGFTPPEMPVAIICANRPLDMEQFHEFRFKNRFYPVSLDHQFAMLVQHPYFFAGKTVINIDSVFTEEMGKKTISSISCAKSSNLPSLFTVPEPEIIPAETWVLSLTAPNPRKPHPTYVQIDPSEFASET